FSPAQRAGLDVVTFRAPQGGAIIGPVELTCPARVVAGAQQRQESSLWPVGGGGQRNEALHVLQPPPATSSACLSVSRARVSRSRPSRFDIFFFFMARSFLGRSRRS